ncbi:MAG TPA: FlgD immunoglobulin-like domain containing protein [Candidatus Limnocylindrales bacterium]
MRTLAFSLVAALLAGLGTFAPIAAPAAQAATGPKVAVIVGATHGATAQYRTYGNEIAATALKYTSNVVKVFSPNATWTKVKAAINGASIVVYLGHGNGWPSPYTYDPNYTTKDGFGLNYDVNGDGKLSDYENKYYGEPSIRTLTPAKNAVVLLFHLCYASGNSEPGDATPTLTTARKRVDNYAAAFLKAGARAVIANGHSHNPYYIDALFTTRQTIDEYWRHAPDFHNRVGTYDSTRSAGYTYQLDPETSSGYYRSIAGAMTLTTTQVTGAAYASTSGDPATFVVPGNATPTWDGAPVYGSVDTAAEGVEPVASLPASAVVRIDGQESSTAVDGTPIFRVHSDGGVEGWMTGGTLTPRDSAAPRVWGTDEGAGVFSPNGDGRQDDWSLSVSLSEPSAWSLKILDGSGAVLDHATGSGDVASLAWAPDPGSIDDGTYTWRVEATDSWGNGPLVDEGSVRVDTVAPVLALADADAQATPDFAPNGDGYRETFSLAGASTESGSLVATVLDDHDTEVDALAAAVSGGSATLTWDGKGSSGYVPDGRYTLRVQARDRAGNRSDAQLRTVDVYAALGFVTSSRTVFFPQDGDALSRTTTFSMRLQSPATVSWTVVDAAGTVVRTFATGEATDAGTWTRSWDGRNDAGAFVPRGRYRSEVRATGATNSAVQRAAVVADAFRFVVSDSTPGRGQRITVTIVTPEALSKNPRISFYQPGIDRWSVATTKVSSATYRATVTLRSSKTGTLRVRAYGYDTNGRAQAASIYLPLH